MPTEYSPFLDRKLTRRFQTYDTDGDGYLERRDFELAADRMAAEFGLDAGDVERKRLVDLCVGLWEHLREVAPGVGGGVGFGESGIERARISEAEYKAAFASGLLETPDSFDAGYVPFLESIMAIADADADGRLTAEDHVRWTGSLMNLDPATARDIHRRLDADGDGLIDTHDLLGAIREYYFDESPESAGSWLLGPLD